MKKRKEGRRKWYPSLRVDLDGYIWIRAVNHPFCNAQGYVREHRLVIETYLKRYLQPDEGVHHINKIKHDNRLENLMVFNNQGAHRNFDRYGYCDALYVVFDGRNIENYDGGGTCQ